jgi:hypothetical protein
MSAPSSDHASIAAKALFWKSDKPPGGPLSEGSLFDI